VLVFVPAQIWRLFGGGEHNKVDREKEKALQEY